MHSWRICANLSSEKIQEQLQRLQNHLHSASRDQIQELWNASDRDLRTTASQQMPVENYSSSSQEALCLFGDDEVVINEERLVWWLVVDASAKTTLRKQQSSNWFQRLIKVHERVNRERLGGQRVKIAILDTGIKLSYDQEEIYFPEETMKYASWIEEDESDIGKAQDEVGHGTHLATLLARVAPQATIHVARVFKNRKPMSAELKNIAHVSEISRTLTV
jgi:subtilisin family serine protease